MIYEFKARRDRFDGDFELFEPRKELHFDEETGLIGLDLGVATETYKGSFILNIGIVAFWLS